MKIVRGEFIGSGSVDDWVEMGDCDGIWSPDGADAAPKFKVLDRQTQDPPPVEFDSHSVLQVEIRFSKSFKDNKYTVVFHQCGDANPPYLSETISYGKFTDKLIVSCYADQTISFIIVGD